MRHGEAPSPLLLRVVSGAMAGQVFETSLDRVVLGRSASCDVRLDVHEDRQVSGRHAELVRDDRGWVVRDLESLNGTFVNGRRIQQEELLAPGDVLRLGPDGPRLRVSSDAQGVGDASTEATELSAGPGAAARSSSALATRRRALVAVAGITLLVGAAVTAALLSRAERDRTAWERERATLLSRLEDALAQNTRATEQFGGQLDGLSDSLRRSTATVAGLLAQLERATIDSGSAQLRAVQAQLDQALAGQSELRLAASLDWEAIRATTDGALARLYVERVDGAIESGTAFSVADPGVLITAAHLVGGPDGTGRPRRIAVQPAETSRVVAAELVRLDTASDLALIRPLAPGLVTQPLQLNERSDTLQAGQPLALMGFSLQQAVPGDAPPPVARPLASAGILRRVTPDRVELSGYGARGASGSPIMDANGTVLGLLRGSLERNGEQILVAVPALRIRALLADLPQ